jgi:hypothetical protein
MSQPDSNQDVEKGNVVGVRAARSLYVSQFTHPSEDAPLNQPQSTQIDLSQGETNLGDSSEPLFVMYSKVAEDEDKKMAERWRKDADGIIIFVRPGAPFRVTAW